MKVRLLYPTVLCAAALLSLAPGRMAEGDEVCDEFPELHAVWGFRLPRCDASFSVTDRDGYLRLQVPDGFTAGGDYDNWTGADRAPSFERYDMGSGDWKITTRLEFETPPSGTTYHVGLMVGFGPKEVNDVVYWGEYNANGSLVIERTGRRIGTMYQALTPSPVSLQIEKAGDTYYFRHRDDDGLDWVEDLAEITAMTSPYPVSRVGVLVKTWGGTASPQVIADFDYFCLEVPGPLSTEVVTDPVPVVSPISSLVCEKQPNGGVHLSWSTCAGSSSPTQVKIHGEEVAVVPGDLSEVTIDPPLPGGSIINVEVDNSFGRPANCTLADSLVDLCDEFDEDPTAGDTWILRTPKLIDTGPSVSVDANPGFLRFFTPSGATAGHFDNWLNTDLAPSLERYDMGERDWVISTRFQFPDEVGSPTANHHVGLMLGYGLGPPQDAYNDIFYWGQYGNSGTLRVERTAQAITPTMAYNGSPVSLQIQKVGQTLLFSHRQLDTDPWVTDATYPVALPFPPNGGASPPAGTPVSRVGLLIKTWGGNGSPEVTADFDYFCLKITDSPPEAALTASPREGVVPLPVSFSGLNSVDPSGGTLTYAWDFGDGASGTGGEVTHTYTQAGLINAGLTVTDDQKNVGSGSIEIFLSDDASPFKLDRLTPTTGATGRNGLVRVIRIGNATVHCINAGGNVLTAVQDSGFFLNQSLEGNFVISAKVTAGDFTAARSRVGLMARLSNDARSANACMSLHSTDDGYQFQFRLTNGSTTQRTLPNVDPGRAGLPSWIRLERRGTVFIGYYSTDGVTYQEYGQRDVPTLGVPSLFVGLVATSGDEAVSADYCAELSGFPTGPQPPPTPAGLNAVAGIDSVNLNWTAVPDVQGYHVYRSRAAAAFTRITTALVPTNSYADLGLDGLEGVEYCYKVTAVNAVGESPQSGPSCATPMHGDPFFFRRGNINGDTLLDISDAIGILGYLFLGQADKVVCVDAADIKDKGSIDISDAISVLNFLFQGGPAPADPGPNNCGPDVNLESPDLGCAQGC